MGSDACRTVEMGVAKGNIRVIRRSNRMPVVRRDRTGFDSHI